MRRTAAVFLVLVASAAWVTGTALPHVLVTNDDGIDAPGIAALVEALRGEYRITVCAPATEQSGVGHGITYRTPVLVEQRPTEDGVVRYAIHAQPATCVRIGVTGLLAEDPPVLVLSGINRGDNAGRSTWVSGTVAGAREGALAGIPAVAFSAASPRGGQPDFAAAARWARAVLETLRRSSLPRAGELVKVDIPDPAADAKGVVVTRVSTAPDSVDRYEERPGPHGERLFVSRYAPPSSAALGTDVEALTRGYVAVTPLSLDQTDFRALPGLTVLPWCSLSAAAPAAAAAGGH